MTIGEMIGMIIEEMRIGLIRIEKTTIDPLEMEVDTIMTFHLETGLETKDLIIKREMKTDTKGSTEIIDQ